jgi:hypothetical protein
MIKLNRNKTEVFLEKVLLWKGDLMNFNISEHLNKEEKVMLGSYYTPQIIVDVVINYIKDLIDKKTVVVDTSAGLGAFMISAVELTDNIRVGEIDERLYEKLAIQFGIDKVYLGNALMDVSREKYNVDEYQKLIVIGNPPYNDFTSLANNKIKRNNDKPEIDSDIIARDLGISFLKSYDKMKADYVCVLHPLAYLIKEGNFRQLKEFRYHYNLKASTIISSGLFYQTGTTKFPIAISLYERNETGMDFDEIKEFQFDVLEEERRFSLCNVKTADHFIRKYTPTKNGKKVSDIGVYFYQYRDINSLMRSQSFTKNSRIASGCLPVMLNDLFKYTYIDAFKYFFPNDYLTGNLSVLMDQDIEQIDSKFTKACLIWSINNNKNLQARLNEEGKLDQVLDFYNISKDMETDCSDYIKNKMEKLREVVFNGNECQK